MGTFSRTGKPAAIFILALAVAAASFADTFAADSGEFKELIRRAVQANRKASTLSEWKQSGLTPHEVFHRAAARLKSGRDISSDLCGALLSLSGPDLALFDGELREAARLHLPCGRVLVNRLDSYWTMNRLAIESNLGLLENENPEAPLPPLKTRVQSVNAAAGPTFFHGDLAENEVALTFDDGPHAHRTRKILDALAEEDVLATFFMVGYSATLNEKQKRAAREVTHAGHSVGSHSWTHRHLPSLSLASARSDILRGHDGVADAAGMAMPFFRFPYGARSRALEKFVRENEMASFMWNMDSLDWKIRDSRQLLSHVKRQLNSQGRGILLFHDIHQQTVDVIPPLLKELRRRGYTLVVFR